MPRVRVTILVVCLHSIEAEHSDLHELYGHCLFHRLLVLSHSLNRSGKDIDIFSLGNLGIVSFLR